MGSRIQLDIFGIRFGLLNLFCSLQKYLLGMDINLGMILMDRNSLHHIHLQDQL